MKKRTMDFILILIGISVAIFTGIMIWIYLVTGGIPDTLCTCFFVACTGECGFMGWIKAAKTRYQERQWDKEDMADLIKQQEVVASQPEFGGTSDDS